MIDIDFKYYFSIILKRFPLFLLIWLLITVLALVVAYILPPVYRSQASILVEGQQITTVDTTVKTSAIERIQIIEQQIMTRSNLLDIAERFGIFAERPDMSPTDMLERMRKMTEFQQVTFADPNSRFGPSAVAFNISFKNKDRFVASRVANDLVSRILELNANTRIKVATETAEYFDQRRVTLLNQLTELETQIVNLKNENKDSLPERLAYNQGEMSRIQDRLIRMDREELSFQEQKAQLERILENPALASAVNGGRQMSPQQRELEQMQLELAQKSTVYSANNPQILQLKSRIAALEDIIKEQASDDSGVFAPLREQIRQIDGSIGLIARQRGQLTEQLASIEAAVAQTPNVENQLNILEREHATIERQYRENDIKLSEARAGENLELRNQGERFSVLEQAVAPDEPESPNRILIAVGGTAFGMFLGAALIILLEIVNTSVRRPADLVNGLGIQPFATIPYIATRRETRARRMRIAVMVLGVAILIPAAVFAVHQFVIPVDLLMERVIDRFGLGDFIAMFS